MSPSGGAGIMSPSGGAGIMSPSGGAGVVTCRSALAPLPACP